MNKKYFLQVIQDLREKEEILLLGNILHTAAEEEQEVKEWLLAAYQTEALAYPFQAPAYNGTAALWAAKTVYVAAQLILYRQDEEKDISVLLMPFTGEKTSGAILSADLCLRFLPFMINQLALIDPADQLIVVLENTLKQWHYSGVNYDLEIDQLDFKTIQSNPCVQQLYANRIIAHKNKKLANHGQWSDLIKAHLSIYSNEYWSNL